MVDLSNFSKLLLSGEKIFTLDDLVLIWSEIDRRKISKLVTYYVSTGKLFKIRNGLLSTIPQNELKGAALFVIAQKLVTPSYISLQTALSINGINYQYYEDIQLVSYYYKKLSIKINGEDYNFNIHSLSPDKFYSDLGVDKIRTEFGTYFLANKERSVIDSWNYNPKIGLDNVDNIDFDLDLLLEIAKIYDKPSIWKNLELYFGIQKIQLDNKFKYTLNYA